MVKSSGVNSPTKRSHIEDKITNTHKIKNKRMIYIYWIGKLEESVWNFLIEDEFLDEENEWEISVFID